MKIFKILLAASWCKRLGARLPPLRSRVRVSVPPCGFLGGRNGVSVGFSWGFSRFPLPQISIHRVSKLISSISFHFNSPCDGALGVVGQYPCYSRTFNIGASSHLIPRPDLVLDTSWGYLFIYLLHSKWNFYNLWHVDLFNFGFGKGFFSLIPNPPHFCASGWMSAHDLCLYYSRIMGCSPGELSEELVT